MTTNTPSFHALLQAPSGASHNLEPPSKKAYKTPSTLGASEAEHPAVNALIRLGWAWQSLCWRISQLGHTFTSQLKPEPHTQRQERRRFAGKLLTLVLQERITARIALCNWPMVKRLGVWMEEDATLEAVYHALWHFEADTERHETEPLYLDIQLELLSHMSTCLCAGKALPDSMITPYQQLKHLPKNGQKHRFYKAHRKVWYHNPASALYGWLLNT